MEDPGGKNITKMEGITIWFVQFGGVTRRSFKKEGFMAVMGLCLHQ